MAVKTSLIVAGRILAIRSHGGSTFLTLSDGTERLQVYVKKDQVGVEGYAFIESLDVADFIEVLGTLFLTHKGERSILAVEPLRLLAKALRPLPEKWHGLVDIEVRYRKRYLDLLANEEAKAIAVSRVTIVRHLRRFLDELGFIEVET